MNHSHIAVAGAFRELRELRVCVGRCRVEGATGGAEYSYSDIVSSLSKSQSHLLFPTHHKFEPLFKFWRAVGAIVSAGATASRFAVTSQ